MKIKSLFASLLKNKIALISLISAPLIIGGGVLFFALRPSPEPTPSVNQSSDPDGPGEPSSEELPEPTGESEVEADPHGSDPEGLSEGGSPRARRDSPVATGGGDAVPEGQTGGEAAKQAARQAAIDRAMAYWRDHFRTEGYHNVSCANNVCSGRSPSMNQLGEAYQIIDSNGEQIGGALMNLGALLRIDFNNFTFRMTYYSEGNWRDSVPDGTTYYCTYNYKSNTTNCTDNIRPYMDMSAAGSKVSPPLTGPVIRDFFNAHMERAGIKISDLTQ